MPTHTAEAGPRFVPAGSATEGDRLDRADGEVRGVDARVVAPIPAPQLRSVDISFVARAMARAISGVRACGAVDAPGEAQHELLGLDAQLEVLPESLS